MTASLNDLQMDALGVQGFTGSLDERMRQWAESKGGPSQASLNDTLLGMWAVVSGATGSLNDLERAGLVSLGFTQDSLNDQRHAFWLAGGIIP